MPCTRSSLKLQWSCCARAWPDIEASGKPSWFAETAQSKSKHDAPPSRVDGYNVAFVGNIPWEMNKPAIEELFSSLRPSLVRMFDDPTTGRHRGFAHLHFADAAGVDKCAVLAVCAAVWHACRSVRACWHVRRTCGTGVTAQVRVVTGL